MQTTIPPIPSVPIADARGVVSREWYRWFLTIVQTIIPSAEGVNQLALLALTMRLTDMTLASQALFGPVAISNGVDVLYQQPQSTTGVITRAVANNVMSGAATLTLWLVRTGMVRGASTIIFGATAGGASIPAGPTEGVVIDALTGLVLQAGDAIYASSDTAGALNIVGSGWNQ